MASVNIFLMFLACGHSKGSCQAPNLSSFILLMVQPVIVCCWPLPVICSTNGKGPCCTVGVTYELVCKNCGHKYIGETFPSDYTCGKEHVRALRKKEKRSVLWRNSCEKHEGVVPLFTKNITVIFHNDVMLRQIK